MRKINLFILVFILLITLISFAKETDNPVIKDFVVDKKTISYELTQPATVRIRVGSKSGPLYRTLFNWQRQNKGKHTITWNGLDSSGTFNILDNKNFTFSFNYYLPGRNEPMVNLTPVDNRLIISDDFIGKAHKFVHLSQIHKKHKKQYCYDPQVLLKLHRDTQKTEDGFAKINGICPITIEPADKDKFWFKQERFSISIFIDDIFITGEALGYTPYTWNFNPKGINKGKHLITVNMKGFNDHIAIGSLPIYIVTTDDTEKL